VRICEIVLQFKTLVLD